MKTFNNFFLVSFMVVLCYPNYCYGQNNVSANGVKVIESYSAKKSIPITAYSKKPVKNTGFELPKPFSEQDKVIIKLNPSDQQKMIGVINALQADLEKASRPMSLQSNAQSLNTINNRLVVLKNKISNAAMQSDEWQELTNNVLKAMKSLDDHNRATILLGVHDLYVLVPAKGTAVQLSYFQQKLADLLQYFSNRAQALYQRSLSLNIQTTAKTPQLVQQAKEESVYYYQLTYNVAQALINRKATTIITSDNKPLDLTILKTRAAQRLKELGSRLTKQTQDSFTLLVAPVR